MSHTITVFMFTLGLFRVDAFDQALIDLRESMNRDIQSPAQK